MRNYHVFIRRLRIFIVGSILAVSTPILPAVAEPVPSSVRHGGEANLVLPRLDDTSLASFGGLSGKNLLLGGLLICLLGLGFGFVERRSRLCHKGADNKFADGGMEDLFAPAQTARLMAW